MKQRIKYCFSIVLLFTSNLCVAQQITPTVVKVKNDTTNLLTKPPVEFIEGQITTPEQQGFTKFEIDGKIVYRKEEGSLIIEYRPN